MLRLRGVGLVVGWALAGFLAAGCATSTAPFAVRGEIEGVQPNRGWTDGGDRVAIDGTEQMRFFAPVAVLFGEEPAVVLGTTREGTRLVVKSPPHAAGTVDVRIVVGEGTPYERAYELERAYSYLDPPRVDEIVPARLRAEAGGVVNLIGEGFLPDMEVRLDGRAVEVERVSSTHLVIAVPSGPAGHRRLQIVSFPGTSIERTIEAGSIELLAPAYRFRAFVTTRLIDLATGLIVDAERFALSEEVASPDEEKRRRSIERLAETIATALPSPYLVPDVDRIAVVAVSGEPWVADPPSREADRRVLAHALAASLGGRGLIAFPREIGPDALTPTEEQPLAFYTSPLPGRDVASLARRFGATKLLTFRIARVEIDDPRETSLASNQDAPHDEWEALTAEYDRFEELAASIPGPFEIVGALVLRVSDRPAEPSGYTARDLIIEDAVIDGLRRRIPLVEKIGGPVTKPPWLYSQLLGIPDPLAYSSWADFRRANPLADAVFFYRPDGNGLYGRLVDAATGLILWSGRVLPADAVVMGLIDETPHDRALTLLEAERWESILADGERVAVVLSGEGVPDVAALQDGLFSALVAARVSVMEPMLTHYPSPEDTAEADPWIELRAMGATRVLRVHVTRDLEGVDLWTFDLLDVEGNLIRTWSVPSRKDDEDATS